MEPGWKIKRDCKTSNVINTAQLKELQSQLTRENKALEDTESELRRLQAARSRYGTDLRTIDEKIGRADTEHRVAVARSQLHSYTSYIVRKPPTEVTDAEVKALESYLIFIPSIAAALASTLLAITAVLRLKRPEPEGLATIPDDAAAYIFGPLLEAIKNEARVAVAAAVDAHSKRQTAGDP
jgi:hypothetical protein